MTIGTGILLAAILVLATWQIDKHKRWAAVGRLSLWLLAVTAGGGGALWGWIEWLDYRNERNLAAEREDALRVGLDAYWDIALGSERKHVRYQKGEPDKRVSTDDAWVFDVDESGPSGKAVFFGRAGQVHQVLCRGKFSWDCPALVGIEIGDWESDVLSALGEPIREAEIGDDGKKFARFGGDADGWLLGVEFMHERVVGLAINNSKFDR